MSCSLHLPRAAVGHESEMWIESKTRPGVRYQIARVSFGRRIDLARRIREIGRKMEYLEAASDIREKLEGAVLAAEIDRAYLEWGFTGIEGLEIDGMRATPVAVIEMGPLDLAAEILTRIKAECVLSEDERKN